MYVLIKTKSNWCRKFTAALKNFQFKLFGPKKVPWQFFMTHFTLGGVYKPRGQNFGQFWPSPPMLTLLLNSCYWLLWSFEQPSPPSIVHVVYTYAPLWSKFHGSPNSEIISQPRKLRWPWALKSANFEAHMYVLTKRLEE